LVEEITKALWGTRVSPSTVSELNQKIYVQIEEWRQRPIEKRFVYVQCDQFLNHLGCLDCPVLVLANRRFEEC
jgi:hypothetical protein